MKITRENRFFNRFNIFLVLISKIQKKKKEIIKEKEKAEKTKGEETKMEKEKWLGRR